MFLFTLITTGAQPPWPSIILPALILILLYILPRFGPHLTFFPSFWNPYTLTSGIINNCFPPIPSVSWDHFLHFYVPWWGLYFSPTPHIHLGREVGMMPFLFLMAASRPFVFLPFSKIIKPYGSFQDCLIPYPSLMVSSFDLLCWDVSKRLTASSSLPNPGMFLAIASWTQVTHPPPGFSVPGIPHIQQSEAPPYLCLPVPWPCPWPSHQY